ncbi:hypothetical protein, conserved [Trypanosoma brucei gambiense DAL972]|uniref:Uncharacterized protein n=1 Tax=Trypanosoma brucei gambiense (strain MHOM/CI/86/DAL972) TaxID=679716 RepID=C9ZK33_TRYB9|nr:hypothetical protein, conserved [Trypanosoma brucei gambiense DAL972]CBH09797.1 hypothetical protein, conserved [Trypanosoma brucei gambiense DAL972]|eukprot:XP_011772090.1 hypothetical protein, conserved [Trypanosoma brucei gambiense DAL972]
METVPESLSVIDPFGVLDTPLEARTYMTGRQYIQLTYHLGEKLGIKNVDHYFNLPAGSEGSETEGTAVEAEISPNDDISCLLDQLVQNESNSEDVSQSNVTSSFLCNPPLCVHFVREGAMKVIGNPKSLPTVACKAVGEKLQGPPHVHCLFCLQTGDTGADTDTNSQGQPYVQAADLRHCVQGHFTEHMNRRNAYLNFLEEGAATLPEARQELLECSADREGRHTCFIASAGSAACPVVVSYCAACDQMAPLATFLEEEDECTSCETVEQRPNRSGTRSVETVELILARLLLACELRVMLTKERGAEGSGNISLVQEESYIFIATPFLFGEEEEELSEEFETGADLTHSSVILPAATVVETAKGPCLCLLKEEGEELLQLLTELPPYRIDHAVVGFVLQWQSASAADERITWALDQGKRKGYKFGVQRRLVYVEDTDEWVIAHVLHNPEVSPSDGRSAVDSERSFGDVRTRELCSITKMIPLSLMEQFIRGGRGEGDGAKNKCEDRSISTDVEVEDCPYGMEARTINYFAQMTALAKAMSLATSFM